MRDIIYQLAIEAEQAIEQALREGLGMHYTVKYEQGDTLAVGDAPDGALWETVQASIRTSVAPWHDGTLVRIDRLDGGVNYAAPGEYQVFTRTDGYRVVVEG